MYLDEELESMELLRDLPSSVIENGRKYRFTLAKFGEEYRVTYVNPVALTDYKELDIFNNQNQSPILLQALRGVLAGLVKYGHFIIYQCQQCIYKREGLQRVDGDTVEVCPSEFRILGSRVDGKVVRPKCPLGKRVDASQELLHG